MNSNVIKLLLGLCLAMLLILLIEWALSDSPDQQYDQPLSITGNQSAEMLDLPELKVAKQTLESYADMVDSPLFIEGRKPLVDQEEETISEEVSKIDDLSLIGIYTVEGKLHALFSKQSGDEKYSKKPEGDEVSGWVIMEIQSDKVLLERAGDEQTLMLRKPRPQKPAHKPGKIPKSRATRKSKPRARKKSKPANLVN
ncbi:MAG: hypothetical protein ACKE51_07215 [Methylococcaceae bacterium]